MLARLPGWGDEDVLALLALFRKHLRRYVYASDTEFVEVVHAELPDKPGPEIQETVKSLMLQFGVALSTKNFRNEVIMTDGGEVFVHEHIYESISQLPENKVGGVVWLPDELSRFFQKATQNKKLFFDNHDVYFERINMWGKSVTDTKNKFYLLREMFMKEKRRPRQRVGVDAKRYEVLEELFRGVTPLAREKKTQTIPKGSKLWTSQDLEMLVDFVVRITRDIQATGSSELVKSVAVTLRRTEQSCMNKLTDIKTKYLKKAVAVRAANLPDVIYDPTSDAHKIFNAGNFILPFFRALVSERLLSITTEYLLLYTTLFVIDWSDSNDPYALGYLALRSNCLRDLAVRHRKRNRRSKALDLGIRTLRPKRRLSITTREVPQSSGTSTTRSPDPMTGVRNSSTDSSKSPVPLLSGREEPTARLPANDYAAFVHDIGEQCQWADKVAHNVLRCMQQSIDLYRANKLVEFFKKVASLTPDVTFLDLFANAQHILTQFEQRFGTLDGFENLALETPNIGVATATNKLETQAQSYVHGSAADTEREDAGVNASRSFPSNTTKLPKPDEVTTVGTECAADDHNSSPSENDHSPESPNQTATEDARDEHSSSVAEKQSSPEDIWDIGDGGADEDPDVDEDNQSVAYSDDAWSGSSIASDGKGSHHAEDKRSSDKQYQPTLAPGSSKKPSKRGKGEHYGKSIELAKKRRLEQKNPSTNRDEENEDEDYDAGDNEDGDHSEDADDESAADVDSGSSSSEHEESPHPLQYILSALDAHVAELEKKRQQLIERKEDREWHQRGWDQHHLHQEYTFQVDAHSIASDD